MRIANHSLFLKPTVMYLLHFAGKGAERRGEVGVLFQELRDLCLVGECQQLTSCKHPFDILSQCSELRPGHKPQSPDIWDPKCPGMSDGLALLKETQGGSGSGETVFNF